MQSEKVSTRNSECKKYSQKYLQIFTLKREFEQKKRIRREYQKKNSPIVKLQKNAENVRKKKNDEKKYAKMQKCSIFL